MGCGLLLVAVAVCGRASGAEGASRFDPAKVKAAFVFSFARYIEWPPQRFSEADSPFVIGVTPRATITSEIREIVQTRQVQGRSVEIAEIRSGDEARAVHLLFIAPEDERHFRDSLQALAEAGVATVGESEDFHAGGGLLMLFLEQDRLRFRVGARAQGVASVRLSSHLLKLAAAGGP